MRDLPQSVRDAQSLVTLLYEGKGNDYKDTDDIYDFVDSFHDRTESIVYLASFIPELLTQEHWRSIALISHEVWEDLQNEGL